MQFSKINFRPTNQVARYLMEIQQFWEQKTAEGVPAYEIKNQDWLQIETTLPHERISFFEIKQVAGLLNWLEKNHAIEFKEDYSSVLYLSEEQTEGDVLPEHLLIRVRDIVPIQHLEKEFAGVGNKTVVASDARASVSFDARARELCLDGKSKRTFQENPKNKSFNFGRIFAHLWPHRKHYTLEGLIPNPQARPLTIESIERALQDGKSTDYASTDFVRDLQSNLAKIRTEGIDVKLMTETRDNGAELVQFLVDERSR